MSCGVGRRHGLDLCCCGCGVGCGVQLQLDPYLALKPPYAVGVALEKAKRLKKIYKIYYEKIKLCQVSQGENQLEIFFLPIYASLLR